MPQNIPPDVKRLRSAIGNAMLRRDYVDELNYRQELAAIQLGRKIDAALASPGLTTEQRATLAARLQDGAGA